jgi:DNA mismatch repair ATPase MutL
MERVATVREITPVASTGEKAAVVPATEPEQMPPVAVEVAAPKPRTNRENRPVQRPEKPVKAEKPVQMDVFQRVVREELQKLGDARGNALREDRLSDIVPIMKVAPVERGPLEAPPMDETTAVPPPEPRQPKPDYRIIGVVLNTYILIEADDSLVLIDQHAAHERLQYEKFMEQLEAGRGSQQLLTPMILRLSAREIALIMDNLEVLKDAGYDVEPFGETDIQVRAVPFILGKADLKPAFMDTVNALNRIRNATVDLRRAEVMQMACKSAVKGGDPLSRDEIEVLIQQMLETGAPPTCPHGRPVMKSLSRRELEKMFKRIQ